MDDQARVILCQILQTRGRAVLTSSELLEGTLLATLAHYPRELNVLLAALHEEIPTRLAEVGEMTPERMAQLAAELEDCQMLKTEAARWAVESWAQAIGQAPAGKSQAGRPKPARAVVQPALRQLKSRLSIEVLSRHKDQPGEKFKHWGNTPGTVPLPDDSDYIFSKLALTGPGLQKLAAELAAVGEIYGIDLGSGRFTGEELIAFLSNPAFTDLRSLMLSGVTSTTDAVLEAVARLFPDLEMFNPGTNCYITDDGLAYLREMLHLRRLDLSYCQKITNRGMAYVRVMEELEVLSLNHVSAIGDDGLAHLQFLPRLYSLDLSSCLRFSAAGMDVLGRFPALTDLRLDWNTRLDDSGLTGLQHLSGLRNLSLIKCTGVSDAGIAMLANLPTLEDLDLAWCEKLSDDALIPLGRLRNLRHLSLYQCRGMSDRGARYLSMLTELRSLKLAGVEKLTDEGLGYLSGLYQLEELTLDGKHITLAGLTALVDSLPHLNRLHVWNTMQASQSEVEKIRRPGMDVWIRGEQGN